MKIDIQNVVASASAGADLDLEMISMNLEEAEYVPDRFPGLIYRIKKPKTATLLFSSGKLVCTGAKSVEIADMVVQRVMSCLRDLDIDVLEKPDVKIQNIVATTDLGTDLNLNSIAITLGLERVEYEPEQFPGLVFRVREPRVVALLFGSGKVVLTGARQISDIDLALAQIRKELADAGLII